MHQQKKGRDSAALSILYLKKPIWGLGLFCCCQ